MHDAVTFASRFTVDDGALTRLHGDAVGESDAPTPWAERLARYSVSWVGAFCDGDLVGFVHACWDGGRHAFALDTVVRHDLRRRGIGRELVRRLAIDARDAGCEWLHVDFEADLAAFYLDDCGFRSTAAGLLRLTGASSRAT